MIALSNDKIVIESDQDGFWGYCHKGWHNSNEGTHQFFEETEKELLAEIDFFLAPCDCNECRE